jgi:hypothetical protein
MLSYSLVEFDRIADKLEPDSHQRDEEGRVCSICGKRYNTEPALKVHMKMKHNQELT